jgi:hypothetical protein
MHVGSPAFAFALSASRTVHVRSESALSFNAGDDDALGESTPERDQQRKTPDAGRGQRTSTVTAGPARRTTVASLAPSARPSPHAEC